MLTRGSTCQNLFCAMDEEMHLSLFPSPFVHDAHTASQQAFLSSRGWPSVKGALPPPSLSSPALRLPLYSNMQPPETVRETNIRGTVCTAR